MKPIFVLILMLALTFAAPIRSVAQDVAFPPAGGMDAGVENPEEEEQQPAQAARMNRNATIRYDSESGQIVVLADDETNQYIKQVIDNLDRPVPQVLIKVLFIEVTHTKDLDLGVEASFKDIDGNRTQSVLSAFGLASETRGGIYQLTDTDVNLLVRAMAVNNKLEVLSRPSIMARNNPQASITVGQTIPIIDSSRVTDAGQTINTISYRDVGIILRVTPHISPDRLVEMDVSPEISKLTSQTVPISDTAAAYVIDTRSADTRVVVMDGHTAVIGGMMEDSKIENVKKIPLLGDIPALGALFRRTVTNNVKTELLIFLTPYVVERTSDVAEMSEDEKNRSTFMTKVIDKNQLNKFLDTKEDRTRGVEVKPAPFSIKMPARKKAKSEAE
ncbi:hypothetical protein LLG95_02180 [bacterium]|nr:hypothetical protein [bacterium]